MNFFLYHVPSLHSRQRKKKRIRGMLPKCVQKTFFGFSSVVIFVVSGLGFGFWGLGVRVWGLGFRVCYFLLFFCGIRFRA